MTHNDPIIIKHPDTGFISVAGDDACAFAIYHYCEC